jgi:hypothetical protein
VTEPVDVLIQAALCAWLKSPDLTVPATPIAMPLVSFTPAPKTPYLDVQPVLRAAPEHFGISNENADILRGIFQVDAVVPDGHGEAPGVRLASLVKARFAQGTKLVAGTQYLRLNKTPTIAAAVKDAPWVRFPVSIPFLLVN